MNNETVKKLIQDLVDNELLLIDTGETLSTCTLKMQRKFRGDGKEIVLFIVESEQ